MERALREGGTPYQPVLDELDLVSDCGNTLRSLDNLRLVADHLGQPVSRVEIGPGGGTLVTFGTDQSILIGGFRVGYSGQGPGGLALFLEEQGFGEYFELDRKIIDLPEDFVGVLVDRTGFFAGSTC